LIVSFRRARLAQAKVAESRLCFFTSYSLRQIVRVLGDLLPRSGENISPKRENEDVRLCFGVPRIGEEIRVLGDKAFRPGERFLLKRDLLFNFAFCLTRRPGESLSVRRRASSPRQKGTHLSKILQVIQFSTLAQARKLSLSETGLVA